MSLAPPPAVIAQLKAVVGPEGVAGDTAPFSRSYEGRYEGVPALVLMPASTDEVARILQLCAGAGVGVVPQGGNTGLAGAAQPDASGHQIILRLDRMKRLRAQDSANGTMTVEAGMVLAQAQAHAEAMGCLLPLSLASEGTCQIGGVISTNAGGVNALCHGTMRAQVVGLEVVLADGRIWDGLRALRKDCAGYDLKQMFIGAEGTLGIVTAAVLRLQPALRIRTCALVALESTAQALDLLVLARDHLGESLQAFEIMRPLGFDAALAQRGERSPFPTPAPLYALVDVGARQPSRQIEDMLEALLVVASEKGMLLDAVIASSQAQYQRFWSWREAQGDVQKLIGEGIKHDVSVPVSSVPDFLTAADAALETALPGIRLFAFGHLGDGNIHYNPIAPDGMEAAAYRARRSEVNTIVHDLVARFSGSISAEHGLGQLRVAEAERYKSAVELDLMRKVKHALDPQGLMNPGKVLRAP